MLDLTQWISEIRTSRDWTKTSSRLGPMFQNIQDAINQAARAAGVDSTQHLAQPNPPAKLNIKTAGELAHVTIEDHSARSRSLHYFVEYANNKSFSGAHVEHLGVSRGRILNLPTKDDNGNTQNWYFRSYSMEPGSKKASSKVYYGQQGAPTAVQMSGSTQLSLLHSTGSGTAPTDGQKAGTGFGTVQNVKTSAKV